MSKLLISEYQREVEEIIRYGGSRNESSIRGAFQKLLGDYCKTKDFRLIPELEYAAKNGKLLYPDGTVKDALRLDWGYWESKDEYDNLDEEIEKKFTKGYPRDNIIFEDSQTAVLIQQDSEQLRVSMQDAEALDQLLQRFIDYERPEVKGFREALEQFKQDVPAIIVQLRDNISQASQNNKKFQEKRDTFLQICRNSINPEISLNDVREMIIQHILTEDIFTNIFNESQFHRENNIARTLSEVVQTFFTGAVRRNTLGSIEHYYAVIRRSAANIANHHEKQKFLKVVYENFYKGYNPKAADRLGIVYTPNEIVRFMIESTDYLLHQHFGKVLGDEGVEILDPATGTGTFITELIEYLPAHQLRYKYLNEIHCNEVAILPYYIANLNIEYTYQQKMGEYLEFENICFVDTLDHTAYDYKQMDLFAMTLENTERIQRQNDREISVIIGNPPYNAWQESFSDNNANRVYQSIDQRIRETYVKQGQAQNQNALYDMYVRFYRWATDRISKNGIIAFVTNSSFINALTFDGFRKVVQREFRDIYLIDLGGNIRAGDKTGNVFGIKVGVALGFLVKRESNNNHPCSIHYWSASEMETVEDKLGFLASRKFEQVEFKHIQPDKKQNWIKLTDNDFDELLPLVDKAVKAGRSQEAVFQLFSRGVATQRDEWVYDFSDRALSDKMKFFVDIYQRTLADADHPERNQIKWDRELTKYLQRRIFKQFDQDSIVRSLYRPYTKQYLYFDRHFNGMTYQWFSIFPDSQSENISIWMKMGSEIPLFYLATQYISDLLPQGGSQCLPLYRYDENGNRQDNITDWALEQFQSHYAPSPPAPLPRERGAMEVSLPGERDLERGHNPGQDEGVPSSPSPFSHGRRGASEVSLPGERDLERGHNPGQDVSQLAGARRMIPEALLQRAKELRQSQTPAEQILWECLRAKRLQGAKFRRQHNIGQCIVDFYCHGAKLVIEVDGGIHEQQKERDADRDNWFADHGFRVLRFKNEEVTENLIDVLARIALSLYPSPTGEGLILPSPAGEGLGVRANAAGEELEMRTITKLDIFHYTYAVLHNPHYREKYELNLKRDFPRLPFYDDFFQWANWGQQLMHLHLNYETLEPYPLERVDIPLKETQTYQLKLKADKTKHEIILDNITTLKEIPPTAWDYKLGNRCALEWILDQYKEKKPRDATIREKFNTYRFINYKETVVDLLLRVCTVSVETMKIIEEISAVKG